MGPLSLPSTVCVIAGAVFTSVSGLAAQSECQRAKLTDQEGQAGDRFGFSVGISSDIAMVGAPYDDDRGDNFGSVFVFERQGPGATWRQIAQLPPEGSEILAGFGRTLGLDRDLAVIGVRGPQEAYVFERVTGEWTEGAQLIADDWWFGAYFGESVAVSGEWAVVGAPDDDDNGWRSGSAYVFERDPKGAWPQVAKLLAHDGEPYNHFASAVAIAGDVVAIGAPDDNDLGNWSGSAYVFERDPNGAWSQVIKLLPHDGAGFWNFGTSVAVGNDLIMVGADHARGETSYSGAAYVFERDPNGVWTETAKLVASDGQTSDAFGRSVALDGDVAVISAPWDHQATSGSAYVFVRQPSGTWSEIAKLVPNDGGYGDEFGCSASLDGNTALIGAKEDDDLGEDSGSAYVFAVGPDNDGNGVMDVCECIGDLDHDYDVDLADLAQLLSNYGMTNGAVYEDGDLDGDGDVDLADLAALLANYGMICP